MFQNQIMRLVVTMVVLPILGGVGAFAATTNVAFGNFFFNPSQVTVNQGDTVNWVYQGGTHSITGTGAEPMCGNAVGVTSCSVTFNVPGAYPYMCIVHSSVMTGLVSVATTASPVLTNFALLSDGTFQLQVTNAANRTNIVQRSTNLASSANWVSIGTNVPPTNSFSFSDPPAGFPIRFYRVTRPQ